MSSAYHASCDRPHNLFRSDHLRPGWVLVASIAASSLGFIDGSIIDVALPAIGKGLHGGSSDLQWTINGYLLPLSALLLLGGAVGDNFGRRRLLVAGLVVFALASLGCGFAPNFHVLIAMRALQGVGGAMVMPNSLALLGAAFSGDARGRAIGTWAAAGVGFSAIGPPLGGWLILVSSWRTVFLINVPVAIAALLLVWIFVPEAADEERPLDWTGAALATVALGFITFGVTLGSSQSLTPGVWAALAIGAAAFALFVVWEHRRGADAMMPLAMFASRAFTGLTLVTFLIYAALGGLFILFPYVLIKGGYTPLQAGLALLPFSLIVGALSRPMSQIANRFGPRLPLVGGSLAGAFGYALLALVEPGGSYWTTVVPGAAVVAAGTAGAVAPLTTAVLDTVSADHAGTASGFNSAVARTGGLVATAFSGIVLSHKGDALVGAFHTAAFAGAAIVLLAALAAFVALGSSEANKH